MICVKNSKNFCPSYYELWKVEPHQPSERRKMKKFCILLTIFISCFAVMLTACGNKNENKLRVSEVTHSVFYAPLYVAINNGYFKEEGLEIELTNAGGSDTVMSSLTSNSADIGLMGPESVIYVRNNGMKNAPKIFAQLTACDGSYLIGRSSDENNTSFEWSSLKGKYIIAGRKGGMPAMTLKYILEKNYNLTTGKSFDEGVDTVLDTDIAFNLTGPTFVGGTGDYVTMFDPVATQTVQDSQYVNVAALGDEVKDVPYTCFVANQSYLNKNSDKIDKFMRALKKGYDFLMQATDDQIVNALKKSFSDTEDELIISSVKSYIEIGAYADSFVLKESSWNTLHKIIDNAGELKANVNYADAVDISFASKLY